MIFFAAAIVNDTDLSAGPRLTQERLGCVVTMGAKWTCRMQESPTLHAASRGWARLGDA